MSEIEHFFDTTPCTQKILTLYSSCQRAETALSKKQHLDGYIYPRTVCTARGFLNTYKHRPHSKTLMISTINAYIMTEHFARQCAEQLFDLYLVEGNEHNDDVNVVISIFTDEGI